MHDSCYAAARAEEPVKTPPSGSKGWSINRMSESIEVIKLFMHILHF